MPPLPGGLDLFVHIRDFPSGTGQTLTFEVETRADGKMRAHRVPYPVASRAASRRRHGAAAVWTLPRLLVVPVFAVLYGCIVWSPSTSQPSSRGTWAGRRS